MHELIAAAHRAGEISAKTATAKLRRYAYDHSWPSHLTRHINVVHRDGSLQIDLPEHISEEAQDLEYGTEDTAPNPVLRTFTNRMSQHSRYGEYLDQHVGRLL